MLLPDKHTYKATVTQTLRDEIALIAYGTFLEIGCDVCYTTESLVDYFDKLIALDISEQKIKTAQKRIKSDKVSYITGTSSCLQQDSYNVVLIDAMHSYDCVLEDFERVYENNLAKEFTVFFHDYGLQEKQRAVKEAVHDISKKYNTPFCLCGEESGWNPLGLKTVDYEAARIKIIK